MCCFAREAGRAYARSGWTDAPGGPFVRAALDTRNMLVTVSSVPGRPCGPSPIRPDRLQHPPARQPAGEPGSGRPRIAPAGRTAASASCVRRVPLGVPVPAPFRLRRAAGTEVIPLGRGRSPIVADRDRVEQPLAGEASDYLP